MARTQPAPAPPTPESPSIPYRDALAGQKAETRKRILASARSVFLREGFMDANLNEVATVAGVGKGTLYRHFENKGELYVAMLAEHGEAIERELLGAVDPGAPTLQQIEQLGQFYLGFWLRYPEHFQLIWAVQNRQMIGPISDALLGHIRGVFEKPLRMLEALLQVGVERGEIRSCDPWNTANALAMAANAVIGPIVGGGPQVVERDLRKVYDQLLTVIVAGLARPAQSDPT